MAEQQLMLLDFWPSPFAARVRIALREKGLQFESQQEDFRNKSDLLLETNPIHKKIPVLIHNGKPFCESHVIVEYIDEVWSHRAPSLLPSDPSERAKARFWANFIDQKMLPAIRALRGGVGEDQEAAKKELECFKVLEDELGDKKYFGGETFGFVDISLISFYSWFYVLEMRFKLSMEELFPKLVEWCRRCSLRDSVSQSLPDQHKVYEYFLERFMGVQSQQ